MLRISTTLLFLALLSACDPSVNQASGNQFRLEKKKLFFLSHELPFWQEEKAPYCEFCSFNLYSKKMLPTSMLFRQVNNESGDLVFLAATNIRHGFALQTGIRSYAIQISQQGEAFTLTYDMQKLMTLHPNQKDSVLLGDERYFVVLRKNDTSEGAVDIIFWLPIQ